MSSDCVKNYFSVPFGILTQKKTKSLNRVNFSSNVGKAMKMKGGEGRVMNRHIFAMLFGGVLVLLMLASGAFGADGWWNESWQYRRAITINNTENPHDLFDYQVKIVVPRFNGMNYNFSDIRFIYKFESKVRELPYWIENFTNESAIVWVKVPFIPKTSNTTIYMYYGNPSAISQSNGDSVFILFDDFESGSLNKWNVSVQGGVPYGVTSEDRYSGEYARYVGPSACPADCFENYKVEFTWKNTLNVPTDNYIISYWRREPNDWGGEARIFINGNVILRDAGEFNTFTDTGWYTKNVSYTGNISSFKIVETDLTNAEKIYMDNIIVRKYTSPEPSVTIGVEQSKDFYITLNTNKANYSTGDVVNLVIEVNRTQGNPQVMKFRLELEDLDGKPDVLIETGSFVMPAKFHKKVVLRFIIPESPFVSSGRYAFKAYLIEPSLDEVLAYDAVYFNVTEKEAKAKAVGSILT